MWPEDDDRNHRVPAVNEALDLSRRAESNAAFVASFQKKRLNQLVRSAYRNCLFYRRRYSRELVDSFADISQLPILSRSDLQENLEGIAAKGLKDLSDCCDFSTSGSTGQPITVLRGRNAVLYDSGLMRRIAERHQIAYHPTPDRPALVFYLNNVFPLAEPMPMLAFGGFYRFSSDSPIWEDSKHMLSLLAQMPGVILSSNPQSLRQLLDFSVAQDPNQDDPFRPSFIVSGGAALDETLRKECEQHFDAPLVNVYATVEVGTVATECSATRALHVESTAVIVECVDADGNPVKEGEIGELLLTDLRNPKFPIIRYQIGDFARLGHSPCVCGRVETRIVDLLGRTNTVFVTAEGKTVVPGTLNRDLRALPIRQYQIEQLAVDRFEVRYIQKTNADSQSSIEEALGSLFQKTFGQDTRVECSEHPRLQTPGKKFQAYINSIPLHKP